MQGFPEVFCLISHDTQIRCIMETHFPYLMGRLTDTSTIAVARCNVSQDDEPPTLEQGQWGQKQGQQCQSPELCAPLPNLEQEFAPSTAAELAWIQGEHHQVKDQWQPATPVMVKKYQNLTSPFEWPRENQQSTLSTPSHQAHAMNPRTGGAICARV